MLADWIDWAERLVFVCAVVGYLFKDVPVKYKAFRKHDKLVELRVLRANRDNTPYITNLVVGANVFLGFFLFSAAIVIALTLGEKPEPRSAQAYMTLMLLIATLFFEMLWIFNQKRADQYVKEHGKLLRYRRFKS